MNPICSRAREQRALREKILRQRLRRGVEEGDMPPATDVNALVAFYASIIDGMAIRARDGASRKALSTVRNSFRIFSSKIAATAPSKLQKGISL
jgi:hypothetical protein